jgi:hypothetical protein
VGVLNLLQLALVGTVLAGCGAEDSTRASVGGTGTTGGGAGAGSNSDSGSTGGRLGGVAGPSGGTQSSTIVAPGGGGSVEGIAPACEITRIDVVVDAPDMLIVLDRSLSMTLFLRWEPSKEARLRVADRVRPGAFPR